MLAKEIHDVAGEIDSVSPAATDPGALVCTPYTVYKYTVHRHVVSSHYIKNLLWDNFSSVHLFTFSYLKESAFDDGLCGPSTQQNSILGANGQQHVELRQRGSNDHSSRSIRRQTWNRDDVSL